MATDARYLPWPGKLKVIPLVDHLPVELCAAVIYGWISSLPEVLKAKWIVTCLSFLFPKQYVDYWLMIYLNIASVRNIIVSSILPNNGQHWLGEDWGLKHPLLSIWWITFWHTSGLRFLLQKSCQNYHTSYQNCPKHISFLIFILYETDNLDSSSIVQALHQYYMSQNSTAFTRISCKKQILQSDVNSSINCLQSVYGVSYAHKIAAVLSAWFASVIYVATLAVIQDQLYVDDPHCNLLLHWCESQHRWPCRLRSFTAASSDQSGQTKQKH